MSSIIRFEIDPFSVRIFGLRYKAGKTKAINRALDEIRSQWQLEFVRQQKRLAKTKWPLLSVDYLKRKQSEYHDHENHPDVKYLTTLKRTGRMLDGYIKGIRVDPKELSVSVRIPKDPYGGDKRGFRAFVHQGLVGRPVGVPIRPFELVKFEAIAKKILIEAIRKKD